MRVSRCATLMVVAVSMGACVPPFSEMQSARLLGPGRKEITPFYSEVGTGEGSEHNKVYNQFGFHFGSGISERIEFRGRFERQVVAGEPDDALTVIGAGLKFPLVRDRIAAYIPIGVGFGDELFALGLHPALLITLPVSKSFEINPSTKFLVPIAGDLNDVLWAANLGFAIGPDVRRWALRPEVGLLRNPGESGYAYHASLGLSLGWGK
jgi:hypothetical protein